MKCNICSACHEAGIEALTFESFPLPSRVTVGLLLVVVTLPGFITGEQWRKHQLEKTELARKQGREPKIYRPFGKDANAFMLFYAYSFNLLITTFAFAVDMSPLFRLATAWLSFAPLFFMPTLVKKKNLFEIATSHYAFGVRGCIVAVAICGALYKTLQVETSSPARELRFLSLCCFTYAAWYSCGLGGFAAWAAHPEYGDFGREKRLMLLLMQGYFIGGFVLQIDLFSGGSPRKFLPRSENATKF